MEAWLEERASDGFNMMFPWLPGGLDDFTGRVVPELQRRGIFRTEYEGSTLRDHLGLPRPENRFFATGQAPGAFQPPRSEEHTSELQSLMRISSAVFCLKKKTHSKQTQQ